MQKFLSAWFLWRQLPSQTQDVLFVALKFRTDRAKKCRYRQMCSFFLGSKSPTRSYTTFPRLFSRVSAFGPRQHTNHVMTNASYDGNEEGSMPISSMSDHRIHCSRLVQLIRRYQNPCRLLSVRNNLFRYFLPEESTVSLWKGWRGRYGSTPKDTVRLGMSFQELVSIRKKERDFNT